MVFSFGAAWSAFVRLKRASNGGRLGQSCIDMLRRSGDDGGGKGFTVDSEAVVSFCDLAAPGPQAAAELSWFAVGNRPIADARAFEKQPFTSTTDNTEAAVRQSAVLFSPDRQL